jgi:hypothetical protein
VGSHFEAVPVPIKDPTRPLLVPARAAARVSAFILSHTNSAITASRTEETAAPRSLDNGPTPESCAFRACSEVYRYLLHRLSLQRRRKVGAAHSVAFEGGGSCGSSLVMLPTSSGSEWIMPSPFQKAMKKYLRHRVGNKLGHGCKAFFVDR